MRNECSCSGERPKGHPISALAAALAYRLPDDEGNFVGQTPVPVLDAHAHVWDWQLDIYTWMTAELSSLRHIVTADDLARELAANDVTATVLVQTCHELRESREYLHLAAERTEIVGVVGWVDLTEPAVAETIEELRAGAGGEAFVGVRHLVHDEADPDWLDRGDVRRGVRALGDAGLVFDVLVRSRELPAALRLVTDLPDQQYVINHIAKPAIVRHELEPWSSLVSSMALNPRVACKLSGMVTEADWSRWSVPDLQPYFNHILEAFGPDRMLYGTDWPHCSVAASYAEVLAAARELTATLSAEEQARIFHGTAAAVYGIDFGQKDIGD